MLIELEGLYDIPDAWEDITLNQFIKINEVSLKAPKEDATEEEKIDFYLDYLEALGLPKDELKKVKLHTDKEDELGLINLFNHCWQFTQMPIDNTFEGFESFILDNTIYLFNQDSLDLTGGVKPMANYTYEEYKEANSILTSMTKIGEGKLENLALLCAVFFRPAQKHWWNFLTKPLIEEYDETKVMDRAELFKKKLTMDRVWSAYFFLLKQMIGLEEGTLDYLLKEAEKNLDSVRLRGNY